MIYIGEVKLYASNNFPFAKYKEGQIFGDSDCLLNETRDSKATANTDCHLYMIKNEQIEELFIQFPDIETKFRNAAKAKRIKHKRKIAACEKKYPVYGINMDKISNVGADKLRRYGLFVDKTLNMNQKNSKSTHNFNLP